MKPIFVACVLVSLIATAALAAPAPRGRAGELRIPITVTSKGFEPASIRAKAGRPIVLVVTRRTERTCAKDFVIADRGISRPLPLNQAVEIRLTPGKPGVIRFACAMDMVAGTLDVK